MDLLFKRYADPFLLIDQLIDNNQFDIFVDKVIDYDNDDKLWDFYLHKVDKQSFSEWKESLIIKKIDKEEVKITVNTSYDILRDFKPKR